MMKALRNRLRQNDGFTLIELVVVVAILGILAAVLTPRVLNAMDNAKENGARATGKTIQTAMERYMIAENTYPAEGDAESAVELTQVLSGFASLDSKMFTEDGFDYALDADDDGKVTGYTLTLHLADANKNLTITPGSVEVGE